MTTAPSPRALRIAAAVRWALVAAAAALAAAGVSVGVGLVGQKAPTTVFTCPMHPEVRARAPGSCPACGMDLVEVEATPRDATGASGGPTPSTAAAAPSAARAPAGDPDAIYTCPMHPEVVQRGPGRCPDCRMFLVPRDPGPGEETEAQPGAAVHVAEPAARRLGIVAVPVVTREIAAPARAAGTVELDADAVEVLDVRLPGWLTALRVRAVGEPVRRGAPLGTLSSPALFEAEAQLAAAIAAAAALGGGETLVAPARTRALALGVPAAEVERLVRGGAPTATLQLRAPRSGVVVAIGATAGAYVAPGTPIVSIADPGRGAVLAEIPERDAAALAPGVVARVRPVAHPDEVRSATVTWRMPTADPARRTVTARLALAPPSGRGTGVVDALGPGASVWVEIDPPARRALVVPRDAVLPGAGRSVVFVDAGGGHYRAREVRAGADLGDAVEIVEGLREGERVAARGAFLLEAESRLHGGGR
jgi:Cu(I)/Ag(I) efflux system membrane fusion protein